MPCYHPQTAYVPLDGGELSFRETANSREVQIPCGQCIGCRVQRAVDWGIRITHESKLYDKNSWITLTYQENPVTLVRRDVQLFIKRLRKAHPERRIRYFAAGEYGSKSLRPHYHVCLFNFWPSDAKIWVEKTQHYKSKEIETLWGLGNTDVFRLNHSRALYTGKYSCKKIGGIPAKAHYTRLNPETGELIECIPEFAQMSLKPGIGFNWYERFKTDYLPCNNVVIDGRQYKVPKYYWRKFQLSDAESAETLQYQNYLEALQHAQNLTPERLAIREEVALAKFRSNERDAQ